VSEGDTSRPPGAASNEEPGDSESSVSDFGITARHAAVTHPRPPAGDDAAGTDPRFAVAGELRRITTALVGLPIADDDLREAAVSLAAVAEQLEGAAGPGRRQRLQPDPEGHPQDFFPTSPVIGFANPVAPPVKVEVADGGGLEGTAFFDYQYEGPPTCVHGGVIAMVFDELLGAANIAAGCPGMTGTLTIRYRKPTPLRTELRLEARCIGRQGRKVTTWGGISRGEDLLAEAEGIFIELVPERFLQVVTAHAGDLPPGFTP
jgi:acyl-coenzyme A thioesterase PaaI-like protein